MVRLVDLFREDKDVLSVLLGYLNYYDYKLLSSINRECALSPLRARVFAHSIVRLPFPRLVDDHVDWTHYMQSTFLRGVKPDMLQHISSVSIPHSELAKALAMLPFLDTVCIWSVPKQAMRDQKPQKRQRQQRREDNETRRAMKAMHVTDFEDLTMVTELHLHRSEVLEFSAVANLTNLTSIDMSGTRLENQADYRHLGCLTQLEKLNLYEARIRTASFLRRLVNLKWLDIEGTKISTIVDIQNLEHLEHLNISDIWLENPTISLPNLRKLRHFLLSYVASFEQIVVILDAPLLQKCEAREADVVSFEFLSGSTNLKTLDIRDTRSLNLQVLSTLTNLKKLSVSAHPLIIRAIPWSDFAQLEDLYVDKWYAAPAEYEVVDASFFASLPRLQVLHINQLSDFSWIGLPSSTLKKLMIKSFRDDDEERLHELSTCTAIDTLHLKMHHELPPFTAINGFSKRLVELRLINAVADDFSAIQECTKLEMLDLTVRESQTWRPLGRNVDFSFLQLLTELRVLWLTGRHDFKDVSVLTALKKLTVLRLDRTRIDDVSALATMTSIRQLSLDNTKLTSLPDLSKLTRLQAIGIPANVDCRPFHITGAFPMLYEIWHEEGYNCFWTGHGLDLWVTT